MVVKKKKFREANIQSLVGMLWIEPHKKKVLEGVEPSLLESKSRVMTVRPQNRSGTQTWQLLPMRSCCYLSPPFLPILCFRVEIVDISTLA